MVKERCPGRVVCMLLICHTIQGKLKFVPSILVNLNRRGLIGTIGLVSGLTQPLPLAPYQPQAVNLSIPSVPTPKLGSVKGTTATGSSLLEILCPRE
jgi:hypothetical protein